MTDSLIERVARAFWGDEYDGSEYQLRGARAAITAMREPTKAMLKVGPPFPYMDEYVWKTMIDEALK